MPPFFSVVVPVYNSAPYLRDCLDSVLAQTFAGWEAVCVDDGSTDGSGAILDEYAAKDPRIRVVHGRNAGVGAARNVGIDAANGEYVTFLDADDVYEPSWLAAFHGLIGETGAELVRLGVTFWDGAARPCVSGAESAGRVCYTGDAVADWGCATYSLEGWTWLNAIKRSCLDDGAKSVRFPVGMKFMEDIIFMLNVLPNVRVACQGEFAGYLYRQHATSAFGGEKRSDMVVRLFDESIRLFAAMSAKNRKNLSWLLGRAVVFWCAKRDRSEAGGGEIVRECVVAARDDSQFRVSEVPARWRLGFVALLYLRTFLVMRLLLALQRCWHRLRSV